MPTLLSTARLRAIVPVSLTTLNRWVKAQKFPAPIYVGNRTYWRQDEVAEWIEVKSLERAAASVGGAE